MSCFVNHLPHHLEVLLADWCSTHKDLRRSAVNSSHRVFWQYSMNVVYTYQSIHRCEWLGDEWILSCCLGKLLRPEVLPGETSSSGGFIWCTSIQCTCLNTSDCRLRLIPFRENKNSATGNLIQYQLRTLSPTRYEVRKLANVILVVAKPLWGQLYRRP